MTTSLLLLKRLGPIFLAAAGLVGCLRADERPPSASLKFSFGSGKAEAGCIQILPTSTYTKTLGYGFEQGSEAFLVDHGNTPGSPTSSLTGSKAFFFSAHVPQEGNYRVSVTLGDAKEESVNTIKAELRRLMVEQIHTAPGEFKTVDFIVNVRSPKIAATGNIAAGEVKLKAPRESVQEAWAWDDLLTLEFNGAHPAISKLEIAPVSVPTIFVLGDSTVCDQSREPFASWGQMLPRFFKPEVAIANHAESGETYRDSIGRRRLDKILSLMKPGDYLIVQFGTNDQKQIASHKGGPFTTFKEEIKKHIDGVHAHGGIPIIVSPMERRNFDPNGKVKPSLADYAEGARQAAAESKVAFIDLNAMSKSFYEWLEAKGTDYSRKAFARTDNTHHCNYGAYELAKCIVQGIRELKLPLESEIVSDFQGFNPSQPDAVENFAVPPSPFVTNERPLGD